MELADASCSLNSVNVLFHSLLNDLERPNNMNVDVARDFVNVVFHVLLDGTKASHNHRNCCCFEPPHSLNLDFQVCVFVMLFRSLGFGRGSRVEGTKSRVEGNMSRVEGAKSRVLRK